MTAWVNVTYLEKNTDTTIYVYYGNPSASSASNGTNTFEFFDDFEGTSLDTDKWGMYNSPELTVNNSEIEIKETSSSTSSGIDQNITNYPIPNNIGIIAEAKTGVGTWEGNGFDQPGNFLLTNSSSYGRIYFTDGGSPSKYTAIFYPGGDYTQIKNAAFANTYQIWRVTYSSGNIKMRIYNLDYTTWSDELSGSLALNTDRYIRLNVRNFDTTTQKVDWARIRKYASSEPTANFGTEEEKPIIYTEFSNHPDTTDLGTATK